MHNFADPYRPLAVELPAGLITEWVSRVTPGSKASLNLPVKETPQLPWDLPGEWANVLAFRTDSTRIATLMLANDGNNRSYPMIGISVADTKEALAAIKTRNPDEWAAGWMAVGDRYMAKAKTEAAGDPKQADVQAVYGGTDCTVTDAQRFYSYRRDGACGRMASLIWLANRQ